jgi:predicted DsbA family dithiol-disulfide isomerase
VKAVVWSDYLCPWCYLGLDRTDRMLALGIESVTTMPYELHPTIPGDGVTISPRRYESMRPLFDEAELPFVAPERIPNTHRVLATSEAVRRRWPEAFPALERALFAAHFAEGRYLGDAEVVDDIVSTCGADASTVRAAVDGRELEPALREARRAAYDASVTGTPAWRFDNGFVLPGAQPRETVDRIVRRLLEREKAAPADL